MYRSSPFRSTLNTNVITGLDMCKVCTEAVHSVALWTRTSSQVWTCVKYVPFLIALFFFSNLFFFNEHASSESLFSSWATSCFLMSMRLLNCSFRLLGFSASAFRLGFGVCVSASAFLGRPDFPKPASRPDFSKPASRPDYPKPAGRPDNPKPASRPKCWKPAGRPNWLAGWNQNSERDKGAMRTSSRIHFDKTVPCETKEQGASHWRLQSVPIQLCGRPEWRCDNTHYRSHRRHDGLLDEDWLNKSKRRSCSQVLGSVGRLQTSALVWRSLWPWLLPGCVWSQCRICQDFQAECLALWVDSLGHCISQSFPCHMEGKGILTQTDVVSVLRRFSLPSSTERIQTCRFLCGCYILPFGLEDIQA